METMPHVKCAENSPRVCCEYTSNLGAECFSVLASYFRRTVFWADARMKRIATPGAKGIGWKRIAAEMGVRVGTIYCGAQEDSKTSENVLRTSVVR
jgi:hypothetical protein